MRVIQRIQTDHGPRAIVTGRLNTVAAATLMHASIAGGGDAHVADDEPTVNLAAFIRGSQTERRKAQKILAARRVREAEQAAEVERMESAMQESHDRVVNLALLPAA